MNRGRRRRRRERDASANVALFVGISMVLHTVTAKIGLYVESDLSKTIQIETDLSENGGNP